MAGEVTVTIIGNLGGDPETRTTSGGQTVCNFSVGTAPRVYNRQSQQWETGATTWYRCDAWDRGRSMLATNIANSLRKGDRVVVTGAIAMRTYTDRNGNAGTSLDLHVEDIGPALSQGVARHEENGARGGHASQRPASAPQARQQPQGGYNARPASQNAQGDPWAASDDEFGAAEF